MVEEKETLKLGANNMTSIVHQTFLLCIKETFINTILEIWIFYLGEHGCFRPKFKNVRLISVLQTQNIFIIRT